MSILRKNTVIVDFSVLPKRPDPARVEKFFENEIRLQLSDTTNIQLHNVRNCVFIEMINNETALQYQAMHNNRHTMYCDGKGFKIPVYVEKESVTVRVHDLPPHMPHTTVMDFMEQYGSVISITRERWRHFFPGIYNGVRVLQMKLERQIPSFVTINGETTLVTYRNQPKTCRFCGRAAHPKEKCSKPSTASNEDQPSKPQPSNNNHLTDPVDSIATATASSDPVPARRDDPAQRTNNDNNSENTIDDGSPSSDSGSFTMALANQKRRLSRLKERETKKVCQQGSQNTSNDIIGSNRFQPLVELDWISLSDLQLMNNRSGEKGVKGRNMNCNNNQLSRDEPASG